MVALSDPGKGTQWKVLISWTLINIIYATYEALVLRFCWREVEVGVQQNDRWTGSGLSVGDSRGKTQDRNQASLAEGFRHETIKLKWPSWKFEGSTWPQRKIAQVPHQAPQKQEAGWTH